MREGRDSSAGQAGSKTVKMRQRVTSRLGAILAIVAVGAALLCAGALLAGCGTSATLDPVARAAELSSRQPGVRFTLAMQISSSQLPGGFEITGSGYANGAQKAARMEIDLSKVPGVSALADAGSGTLETVFLYPIVYMHMPFLAGKLPEGKTWMKLDMAKLTKALGGGSIPQAFSLGQADPGQFLQYLRASSGEVRKVGTQQLYGISTTEYQSSLQLSQVLERLPAVDRPAASEMLQHVGNDGSIPVETWIDAQGRVRQVRMSLSVSGSTASGSAEVTMGFTSYGAVPAISPPPAGEVVDLTSLLSPGLGMQSR